MECDQKAQEAYIAKRPILDFDKKLFGYELSVQSTSRSVYGQHGVSTQLLDELLSRFDLAKIAAGKAICLRLPAESLHQQQYRSLPTEQVVIELADPIPTDAVASRQLKKDGYRLLLDDVSIQPGIEELLVQADYLKLDFTAGIDQDLSAATSLTNASCRLIAKNVETYQQFDEALNLRFHLVQGYFFCKPQTHKPLKILPVKTNALRFLQEVNRPDLDMDRLEAVIKQDASLSLNLLKHLNSAAFGLRHEVKSIKHALTLLGEGPIRKWLIVCCLAT